MKKRKVIRSPALLVFDGEKAVTAWKYYLTEFPDVTEIIDEATRELMEKGITAEIAKDVWEKLTDAERQDWLLSRFPIRCKRESQGVFVLFVEGEK